MSAVWMLLSPYSVASTTWTPARGSNGVHDCNRLAESRY